MTDPTVATAQKFFMLDVKYTARQSIVVAADTSDQAVEFAKNSLPEFISDFEVTNSQEKSAAELESLFTDIAASQQANQQARLN